MRGGSGRSPNEISAVPIDGHGIIVGRIRVMVLLLLLRRVRIAVRITPLGITIMGAAATAAVVSMRMRR